MEKRSEFAQRRCFQIGDFVAMPDCRSSVGQKQFVEHAEVLGVQAAGEALHSLECVGLLQTTGANTASSRAASVS